MNPILHQQISSIFILISYVLSFQQSLHFNYNNNNKSRKMSICVIDLGNTQTTISTSQYNLTLLSTILIKNQKNYEIGLPQDTRYVIYDFISLLGTKYQDEQFTRHSKFYSFDFASNSYGKIDIVLPVAQIITASNKRISVQLLVALFLRRLINMFQDQFYSKKFSKVQQFISGHKFYISIGTTSDHPTRYAIKQALQILGIEPILFNSSNAAVCSYYMTEKKELNLSQQICLIEFSDRGCSATIYKLQPYSEKIIQGILYNSIKKGGFHITKTLSEYFVSLIKQQKGIDINRHGPYMNLLNCQCSKVKIGIVQSKQKEGFVRVPDLPDDSTFGKVMDQNLLNNIIEKDINKISDMIESVLEKNKKIKQILLIGGSTKLPIFKKRMKQIGKNYKIINLKRQCVVQGIHEMQKQQIILFDVSEGDYEVTGEEGFKRKLLGKSEDIPDRRSQKAKFPAGQLEFNLKVTQNGVKIAHFLLDSRPTQLQFLLNFEIDRNKLIQLYVRTDKGKVQLISNYEGLNSQQMAKCQHIFQEFQL